MPDITPLGWFHTAFGAAAVLVGMYILVTRRVIVLHQRLGQFYLVATLITAVSALGIYQRGVFGPGHMLAVLTLLAVGVGLIADKTRMFGKWSAYVQTMSFTGTLLFHSIPAITDGLLRLPVGNPVLTSLHDPVLKIAYAMLFVAYLAVIAWQFRWLATATRSAVDE